MKHSGPVPVYAVHPITLWAPLALGLMASCIEARLGAAYRMVYPFALTSQQLLEQVAEHGPGIVLFSNYMWTREANLEISAAVKRFAPSSLVIHGGPDTPAYPEACESYLRRYPFIDYAVHGEGEQSLLDLLATLAAGTDPAEVGGIGYLQKGHFHKTPSRGRGPDPNQFPSPYLDGVFDKLEWQTWNAVPLETNRGCPYGCTFCDWGSATMQKMRRFDMERIEGEIEWLARHKIQKLWIADSNFGIFERDLEITRFICEMKEKHGFPRLVITNYAKNTKKHLVDILEMLVDHGLVGTGIVSLQTRDQGTLDAVKRSNIKTSEYDLLRTAFESRNLPMSTQLMIGLPGSTRESFKEDLRFFFNQNIDVQIFRTVVLPNSPMAHPDYIRQYSLVYDESGMLFETNLLSRDELNHIEQLGRLFRCAHTYGMFRYWLCYLQWDYGLDPIEVLDALATAAKTSSDPWLARIWDHESPHHDLLTSLPSLREELRATGGWGEFWQALKAWTLVTYPQVRDDSALADVLSVQAAVMPSATAAYPLTLELSHDFQAYYLAHRQGGVLTGRRAPGSSPGQALSAYGPGQLEIDDPLRVGAESLSEHLRLRRRPVVIWELPSAISPRGTEADLFTQQAITSQARVA